MHGCVRIDGMSVQKHTGSKQVKSQHCAKRVWDHEERETREGLLSEALIGTEALTQRWESREHLARALNVFWALWTHICLEPSDRQVVEQEWRWEGVESQSVFS